MNALSCRLSTSFAPAVQLPWYVGENGPQARGNAHEDGRPATQEAGILCAMAVEIACHAMVQPEFGDAISADQDLLLCNQ